MMNKKLINLAVAAAIAAPAAVMADATMYGVLHQTIDYIDQDDVTYFNPETGLTETLLEGFSGWSINRRNGTILGSLEGISNGPMGPSNRIGVKGSEDLGNGLKGIYQVEFGIVTADANGVPADSDTGNIGMRNTFVGLAGGFGTFLVGRHDTPLKISTGKLDMFADTMGDYNGALGFDDKRTDNTVAYISPNWSGFQFAGAVHAGGRAGGSPAVVTDTATGITYVSTGEQADSLAEAWSVAAIYSNGPWYASAAYESLSSDLSNSATVLNEFASDNLLSEPFDDYTKWRLGLGILDWNGFSLTGIYEDRSNTGFLDGRDTSSWQVQAGYAFGNNMVKASYGARDRDLDNVLDEENEVLGVDFGGDLYQWNIAFDHNLSKRTKVYALYNQVDDDFLPNWDGFSLGLVHKF
jgi:predicted porin